MKVWWNPERTQRCLPGPRYSSVVPGLVGMFQAYNSSVPSIPRNLSSNPDQHSCILIAPAGPAKFQAGSSPVQ